LLLGNDGIKKMKKLCMSLREKFINYYPPLLGAGIRSQKLDEHTIRVEMKLTPFNKNIVGVHFGGSLYAMCDPWFMLILMRLLGRDYIVWDKAAEIKFIKPGRSTVTSTFHIPQERVDEIIRATVNGEKYEPSFEVDVLNVEGQVVAQVKKLLYVKQKK
jgi:acyl-coenzyme A thioesterase PaaI-like protein